MCLIKKVRSIALSLFCALLLKLNFHKMVNFSTLRRQGESQGRYITRLVKVSFENGFKGGSPIQMADFIVANNLVDALESFNPIGEPTDDFSRLDNTKS